jgi:hypothetical protein
MKPCSICKIEKPLDAFDRRTHAKDGRRAQCRQCRKEVEYAKRGPLAGFANGLRSGYGMSIDDYRGILAHQGGQCAVCRESLTRPVVDHDHKTGRVRGLICFRCNTWLSAFENQAFMKAATRYLREHAMLPPPYEFYKNARHFEQLQRNKKATQAKQRAHPKMVAIRERMKHLIN